MQSVTSPQVFFDDKNVKLPVKKNIVSLCGMMVTVNPEQLNEAKC